MYGKVVSVTDGHFPTYGPMGGGVWVNMGLSMVLRVNDTIDIIVISNNGQLMDIAQVTSMGIDPVHKKVFYTCTGNEYSTVQYSTV